MNHENVVRYFNAWIETQPGDAFSSSSILEEDEEGGASSSGRDPSSDGGSNGTGDFGNLEPDSDSDSSDDSFISFTVSEVHDTSDSVIVSEKSSDCTLSSQGEGEGEEVFRMSPTNYAVDTKSILAQIDRAND